MKLKFNADQQYQIDAVNSIVDILQGQAINKSNFTVALGEQTGILQTELGIGNKLDLFDDEILKNVYEIQLRNGLPKSTALRSENKQLNFTVEMETGTGKTYVYTRTIFELHKRYGFTKYIIVVPSVAIREGVYKSLQITEEHFKSLYDNQPCTYFIYDSSKLGQVRNFAANDDIEIMIINIDAFRKSFVNPEKPDKANLIHRESDKLNGRKPIEFIRETNPIVIIDEPQSVDNTDKAKEAISSLNPLFILRYSATHREKYNLMYRLDPVDAYQKKLVKEIKVTSIKAVDDFSKPYIKLLGVDNKRGFKASVEIDVKKTDGTVTRTKKTVKVGDDLFDISGERDIYGGYIIDDIDCYPGSESIEFTNGEILRLSQAIGDVDEDDIKRAQIHSTIEEHLNKELKLLPHGIKVLSLFFIDRVENYRVYDKDGNPQKGKYQIMFEEEYSKLINKPKYRTLFKDDKYMLNMNPEEVHDGYFSIDKKTKAIKDTSGDTQADYDTYTLIMKDKEKLLSFETPLRFIFSHSALKEGWDNPNVFQVCTLVETRDTFTKRQKIGRGLRLCVNQDGERIYKPEQNVLTVIANESFEDFAENLQREIEEETGVRFGIIEKHSFANISYINEQGAVESLGYEISERLWDYLAKENLIHYNGKVKDELKAKVANDTLIVPQEFKHIENEVKQVIRKAVEKLKIRDGSKEISVPINKQVYLSDEFTRLWDKIKYKTTYSVNMDIPKLIEDCVKDIASMSQIGKVKLVEEEARFDIKKSGVTGERTNIKVIDEIDIRNPLPDILRYLQDETKLTRGTLIEILIKARRFDDFRNNPQKFMEAVSEIINRNKRHQIVDGIKYERIGDMEYYKQELFEADELKAYLDSNAIKSDKSVYTFVVYDSDTEKEFAEKMEEDDDVKVYAKLPSTFLIETPIGNYIPDWAVLIDKDGEEKLFFVVETKGSLDKDQLRFTEDAKIECGRKHFEALKTGIRYELAKDYLELKKNI